MSCIYYIINGSGNRTQGGYIGQDTSDCCQRITDHVYLGYAGALNYGSEKLIRDNSACNCIFWVFNDTNKGGYGLSQRTYEAFWNKWGVGDLNSQKLNIAEILQIAYFRVVHGDLSALNIQIGGQGDLPLVYKWTPKEQQKLTSLCNSLGIPQENITSDIRLTINKFNNANSFQKLIHPLEYKAIRLISENLLSNLYSSPLFINLIKEILVDELSGQNVNRGVRIRNFLEKEVINQINQAFVDSDWKITAFTANDFDFSDLTRRILKVFNDKLDRKTLTIHKVNSPTAITYDIVAQIFQKIKSGYEGQTFKLKVPATFTKSMNIQYHLPKWWKFLEEDMKSRSPDDSTIAINAAKKGSYQFFKEVADRESKNGNISSLYALNPFTTWENTHGKGKTHIRGIANDLSDEYNRTAGLFTGKSETLRWKVRNVFESHDIHGGLLHFWDWYYRQAISLWNNERSKPISLAVQISEDAANAITMQDKVVAISHDGERVYYFLPSTAAMIEENINKMQGYINLQFY